MTRWLVVVPYRGWGWVQRLFRVKRRLRMDKIIDSEIKLKYVADQWDELAKAVTDPELLYVARYRAASTRHMVSLLRKAWTAEYFRRPLESQELRDRVVELHAKALKDASVPAA